MVTGTLKNEVVPSQNARDIPQHLVTTQQLNNYFAIKPSIKFPGWTVLFFALGLVIIIAGASSPSALALSFLGGLGAWGIGGLGIYLTYNPQRLYEHRESLTDKAFDAWLQYQDSLAIDRLCKRLGLLRDHFDHPGIGRQVVSEPLEVRGFETKGVEPAISNSFAIADRCKGHDGKIRWRVNKLLWLVPLEAALAVYETTIDASIAEVIYDATNEYFYQAVSGIGTVQVQIPDVIGAYSFSLEIDTGKVATTIVVGDLTNTTRSLRTLINNKKQEMLLRGFPGYIPSGPPPTYSPSPGTYPTPSSIPSPLGPPPPSGKRPKRSMGPKTDPPS